MMSTALTSQLHRRTPSALAASSNVMDDISSSGRDSQADTFESGDAFVPQTFIVPHQRPAVAARRSQSTFNTTCVIGLVSQLAVFGPAPSIARDVTSLWHLDAGSMHWFDEDLMAANGAFAPVQENCGHIRFFEEIDRFLKLQADWDGDNGIAPSIAAGDAAKTFLRELSSTKFPAACYAIGDGEIIFQWRSSQNFIEVAFDGDIISWYVKLGNAEPESSDDVFTTYQSIDQRLLLAISQLG